MRWLVEDSAVAVAARRKIIDSLGLGPRARQFKVGLVDGLVQPQDAQVERLGSPSDSTGSRSNKTLAVARKSRAR